MTINQLKNILMNVRCGQFILDAGVMGDGFYLQVSLLAADNETGDWGYHKGRKWYVSKHSVESEVVQTALKAILTFMEHEIREQFTYKNKMLFGPHLDVQALLRIADEREMRVA